MKSSRSATRPEQRLIVFVPELEALLREVRAAPRLIAAMTDRGSERLDPEAPQSQLATGQPLPAAPLSRRVDAPGDCSGVWARADAVELVPDLAAVWMQTEQRFDPGPWLDELSALLTEEGMRFELSAGGRGYLALEAVPECRFRPPWALAGESLDHVLPTGPESGFWKRLLNDTQVILHQYRKARSADGRAPGTLWFWGAGALPEPEQVAARVRTIVASDPVLRGLADWLGLSSRSGDRRFRPEPGLLYEWAAPPEHSAEDNLEQLQAALRPAWKRLRFGRLRELQLASRERVWTFGTAEAWSIWR
jgi:hypothetical protein